MSLHAQVGWTTSPDGQQIIRSSHKKDNVMTAYVGIDVSKATLDVILLQDEQQQHGVFDNHPSGFR